MRGKERELRQQIIDHCLAMNASGLNQGTSGNISVRLGDDMLVSPSGIAYHTLKPEMIATMAIGDDSGSWTGPLKPSTEWHFHQALLRDRPDANAVVHAHPTYCTTLAILRKDIPACHYMIAAFGGNNVRCSGYATYGTKSLSDLAVEAMQDRTACLLGNHGMIAIGDTLPKAMWRAVELETIARQYYLSLQIGEPVILSDANVEETLSKFSTYGLQENDGKKNYPARKAKNGRVRTNRTTTARAAGEG